MPPSPASSASSINGSVLADRSDIGNLSSLPPTPGTPMYEKRYRHSTKKRDDIVKDWGFEDKKTADLWMARGERFNRSKRKQKIKQKMKDPDYKYKQLMRKVQAAKAQIGASTGSLTSRSSSRPPSHGRSAVSRDRARHRKHKKRVAPAWVQDDASSNASSNSRQGTAMSADNPPVHVTNWTEGDVENGDNEWGRLPPILR
jgi:hypothetical protein